MPTCFWKTELGNRTQRKQPKSQKLYNFFFFAAADTKRLILSSQHHNSWVLSKSLWFTVAWSRQIDQFGLYSELLEGRLQVNLGMTDRSWNWGSVGSCYLCRALTEHSLSALAHLSWWVSGIPGFLIMHNSSSLICEFVLENSGKKWRRKLENTTKVCSSDSREEFFFFSK